MAKIELGKGDSGATRTATVGDVVEVALEEIATSGYRWSVGEVDATVLESLAAPYDPPGPGLLGAAGVHRFQFRVRAAGTASIHLALARAWAPDAAAETFEAKIVAADADG